MKEGARIFFSLVAVVFLVSLLSVRDGVRERALKQDPVSQSTKTKERVKPEFDIENVMITFYWFDTLEELKTELNENVLGLADCDWNPDKNIAYCDIYAVRATYVDDEEACTIGHEVLHASQGRYHTADYSYAYGEGCL